MGDVLVLWDREMIDPSTCSMSGMPTIFSTLPVERRKSNKRARSFLLRATDVPDFYIRQDFISEMKRGTGSTKTNQDGNMSQFRCKKVMTLSLTCQAVYLLRGLADNQSNTPKCIQQFHRNLRWGDKDLCELAVVGW